ncbi:hypothetical protein LEP1GSC021_3669 [Leptospira noguchii str. 1993005606]|nr:hypothetical protein LEP1GSC021_3669 [Leptospira noguchii str. 1993005606]
MNRHLVSVLWKRSIEAVLSIVTIKFFNNSNVKKNDVVSTEWAPFTLLDDKSESLLLKTSEDLQTKFFIETSRFYKT